MDFFMRKLWIIFFSIFIPYILSAINVEEQLAQHISFSSDQENRIGYIKIEMDRPIDQTTYVYIQFALKEFVQQKVRFIILHLDTPGGEVFAAQKIATLLQEVDRIEGIPVIAYIDKWAISAGAMLAYSCRFIATNEGSSMGAAQPVYIQEGKMQPASEKITSALRTEFHNLAMFYQRNPLIAEAMVDKDLTLVYRDHKIVVLNNDDEIQKTDEVITKKGKLLTLNSQQLIQYGISDFSLSLKALPVITSEEKKEGRWSFSKSLISTYPFFHKIPHAKIITYSDWKVQFFSFLSHKMVASILVGLMLLGFYVEFNTPGFGIFGSIALFCLFLLLLSSFSIYTVHFLEVIIFSVGIILILLEIFVIPGFGLIGILGVVLFLLGLITFLIPNVGNINFNFDHINLATINAMHILTGILLSIIVSFVIMFLLSKYVFQRFLLHRSLVLHKEQSGYRAGPKKMPQVGDEAISITALRPTGKIAIGDEIFHAFTQLTFIDKGQKVTIVAIKGNKIIVEIK